MVVVYFECRYIAQKNLQFSSNRTVCELVNRFNVHKYVYVRTYVLPTVNMFLIEDFYLIYLIIDEHICHI